MSNRMFEQPSRSFTSLPARRATTEDDELMSGKKTIATSIGQINQALGKLAVESSGGKDKNSPIDSIKQIAVKESRKIETKFKAIVIQAAEEKDSLMLKNSLTQAKEQLEEQVYNASEKQGLLAAALAQKSKKKLTIEMEEDEKWNIIEKATSASWTKVLDSLLETAENCALAQLEEEDDDETRSESSVSMLPRKSYSDDGDNDWRSLEERPTDWTDWTGKSNANDRDNSPLRLPGGAGKQQQRYISPLRNPVGHDEGGIQAFPGRGGKKKQDSRLVSSYDFED
ncbi:hypothetical protein GUITHDRAFT_148685 [Guillardia theta CCMP2712]|uniref:Uncharacterized protein n=1 Tax=Guillardia theta (strain CCMP2712) TaxID=905079 RepID=L1I935_GUITC|nr:hypothetical protein GUITHDRAFT_148685 [Guillardia theta CCMP2712]EKX32345.1 hypothetical protein GUITHDRAFT_148685 [Guillardia theta CCMP2712]|eukprot:XP_005819325.1 hypothetical protein GUITHDRAFT_148685 [Guillardia theta CCMP2712]